MDSDYNHLILSGILAILCLWWWNHVKRNPLNLPPGPRGIPIIGNLDLIGGGATRLAELGKIYGPIYLLRLCGYHGIVVTDWKIMKTALVDQSDVFSGRMESFVSQTISKCKDIVSVDGPQMRARKSLAIRLLRNCGFGKSSMENVITEEVSNVFKVVDKLSHEPIRIKDLFFMPLLNVLFGVVTGKTYAYEDGEMSRKGHLIESVFQLLYRTLAVNFVPQLRFVPFDPFSYHKLLRVSDEIHRFLELEVEEHLQMFKEGNEPRNFIDAYLAEIERKGKLDSGETDGGHPYERSCLVEITFNLFMAGMDTSKSTLEWSLLYMALWPEKQRKVQQELDNVIGKNRLPAYADIKRLPYTEATILEIDRCASILPLSIPHRTLANTTLANYTILKDTTILLNIWAVHHDKALWGDPEAFRPERFINSQGNVEKPDYLIPFLIGGRACLGSTQARMQQFLFFSSLLQRYSFSCVPGELPPSFIPVNINYTISWPKPYRLDVKLR